MPIQNPEKSLSYAAPGIVIFIVCYLFLIVFPYLSFAFQIHDIKLLCFRLSGYSEVLKNPVWSIFLSVCRCYPYRYVENNFPYSYPFPRLFVRNNLQFYP